MFGEPQHGEISDAMRAPVVKTPSKYTEFSPPVDGAVKVPLSIIVQYKSAFTTAAPVGTWTLIVPEPTFLRPIPACTKFDFAMMKDDFRVALGPGPWVLTLDEPMVPSFPVVAELVCAIT